MRALVAWRAADGVKRSAGGCIDVLRRRAVPLSPPTVCTPGAAHPAPGCSQAPGRHTSGTPTCSTPTRGTLNLLLRSYMLLD